MTGKGTAMRTWMRNTSEVFHVWAQQSQSKGRCGHVSFRGPICYSYREPIGNIVKGTALITSRKFSVTTSSHTSAALSAVSHLDIICVENPCPGPTSDHRRNLDALRRDITKLLEKQRRARIEFWREWYGRTALTMAGYFTRYAALFKLERMATREYPGVVNLDTVAIQAGVDRAAKLRSRADRRNLRLRRIEIVKIYREWKAGECVNIAYNSPFDALRLTRNEKEIETSKGVKIRVRLACRLWTAICSAKAAGIEMTPNIKVDYYKVTAIKPDGTIIIGCHTIPFFESAYIAAALGLSDPCNAFAGNDAAIEAALKRSIKTGEIGL